MKTKYDEIKNMTIEQMAHELLLVAKWDKKEIIKAESTPNGLYGLILEVLSEPLPDICKECKSGEWDKENGKCEGCDERNSPKTEVEERKNHIPVVA